MGDTGGECFLKAGLRGCPAEGEEGDAGGGGFLFRSHPESRAGGMLGGAGGQLDGLLGMPCRGVPVLQASGGLRPLHRHLVALQSGGWRPRARGGTGWREGGQRGAARPLSSGS